MPLTGEAKRDYNRKHYQRRRAVSGIVTQTEVLAVRPGDQEAMGALTESVRQLRDLVQPSANVEAIKKAITVHELTVEHLAKGIRALTEAERPYGKDATLGPDNDARARAWEIAWRLNERGGLIPVGVPDGGPTSGGARVRMVQIEPDGTERILEIG